MAWQKRLPSLKKLKRLKLNTSWEPEPTVISMPDLEGDGKKHFVIVEFRETTIVEYFADQREAAAFASAIYLALSLM